MVRLRTVGVLAAAAVVLVLAASAASAETAPGLRERPVIVDVAPEQGPMGFVKVIIDNPFENARPRIPGPIDLKPVDPKFSSTGGSGRGLGQVVEPGAGSLGGGFVVPTTGAGPSASTSRGAALAALESVGRDLGLR